MEPKQSLPIKRKTYGSPPKFTYQYFRNRDREQGREHRPLNPSLSQPPEIEVAPLVTEDSILGSNGGYYDSTITENELKVGKRNSDSENGSYIKQFDFN